MIGRVLIAGIGNIFLGDDGFGVEVVQHMARRSLPEGVSVKDFGIRGYDLAVALTEPWELIIMVDAVARGGLPGTIYVIEVDDSSQGATETLNGHGLEPAQAIGLAHALGEVSARLLVVGCEPAHFGGDEGQMSLSPEVEAAIGEAISTLAEIVCDFLNTADLKQGVQL